MAYTNELAFKNTLLTAALTTRDLKQKKKKTKQGQKVDRWKYLENLYYDI